MILSKFKETEILSEIHTSLIKRDRIYSNTTIGTLHLQGKLKISGSYKYLTVAKAV